MKPFLYSFLSLFLFSSTSFAQLSLPAFAFEDLDGNSFTHSNLNADQSVFVMMFDPYCEHCDQQAKNIAEAAEQFKSVQFIFVTLEPENEAIENFRDRHFDGLGLDLHFLKDTQVAFETYFGYTDDAVNIYLYKPGKRLPKYFGEEQSAETLLKYL